MERLSFCDWPGRNSCVLFFGGCNLACPTCHNARIAWAPGSVPSLDRAEVLRFLKARARWLDGVVVSGGEASCVPGLEVVLGDIAALGLPVKLDTNGMLPDVVESLLEKRLIAAVAVDVKGPWRLYPELTGACVETATAAWNLKYLFAMASRMPGVFAFRCTTVPLLTPEDIEDTRRQLPAGHALTLQPYKEPKQYARTDLQARRLSGNVVV
ncbi:radical SAM protein [Megalodesulfovibrio paquesii]